MNLCGLRAKHTNIVAAIAVVGVNLNIYKHVVSNEILVGGGVAGRAFGSAFTFLPCII